MYLFFGLFGILSILENGSKPTDKVFKSKLRKFKKGTKLFLTLNGYTCDEAQKLVPEKYIKKENPPGIVVTILCDRGERYLSGK